MQDRAFVSIETTGINTSTDKIVEIAALKIDKNNLKSLFHQIINPEKEIDKNISNIISYSNEELKKYPKIRNRKLGITNPKRVPSRVLFGLIEG